MALRVVKDIKAEKHPVEFCFENVASMDREDRDVVTRFLGVRPVVACASGLSQVRRRRYLWCSWQVTEAEGVKVEPGADYWTVRFHAVLPPPKLWLRSGWKMVGPPETQFPTFMRALPKKKETYKPTGIDAAGPDALKRWKADQWR